jgi:hypothetical protein
VEKQLAQVMGPTTVPRAALARAPPLVPPSPHHRGAIQLPPGALQGALASGFGGAVAASASSAHTPLALPAPSDAGTVAASLAGRSPVATAPAAASVAGAVHGAPGSGGATQRLQLDKLLSLLESGLPLGGDVKVRLLAARGLAGGADRHTHPYARLTVGPTSVTSPPVWNSSEPVWDHEETFEEVPATLNLVVEVWSLPHAGAQQLLAASAAELEAASTFLGCVTVGALVLGCCWGWTVVPTSKLWAC